MRARLREAVVPVYLFLCLLLGGSAQGIWQNLLLQLIAAAIVGWALLEPGTEPLSRRTRQLLALVAAAVAIGFVQLVPLPPAVWTALPGRGVIADGFGLLGQPLPWMPISLAPYDTIAALLTLLPPIAVLIGMVRLQAYRPTWLVASVLAAAMAAVLLGILQVNGGAESPWYLYRITNYGVATGFFANANHMAALLVVTIPFLAALTAWSRSVGSARQLRSTLFVLAGAILLIVAVGLILNGSLAGLGLGLPVLLASGALLSASRSRGGRALLIAAPLLLLTAIATVYWATDWAAEDEASISVESRQEMAAVSSRAAADFAPLGAGLGTFADVYVLYEDPFALERTYVNHAHNDYLELAVEGGLPAVILLVLFLAWWAKAAWESWRSTVVDPFARAATIASAAILAHSLVDYPARTAAIAGVLAMCLALMARIRQPAAPDEPGELRPSRHLEL